MKKAVLAIALLSVAGCATTSEMPLAPNMVRLDTQASGLLFVGSAPSITMKKAAEATISRGYTHFRLEQAIKGQLLPLKTFVGRKRNGNYNVLSFVPGNG